MGSIKSLARGFFVSATAICIYGAAALIRAGEPSLGLMFLIISIIPLACAIYLWFREKNVPKNIDLISKWGSILFSLQGAVLAFWAFDLATTFYVINIARVASEINPLGWPLGALGALAYYAPTVILSYMLIFRIKRKTSLYAAIPVTAVALCMGSMNLNAGIGNFGFFIILHSSIF